MMPKFWVHHSVTPQKEPSAPFSKQSHPCGVQTPTHIPTPNVMSEETPESSALSGFARPGVETSVFLGKVSPERALLRESKIDL